MAKTAPNPALTSLRGIVGGWTYRRDGYGGMTVYAHNASTQPASSKQEERRELFRRAQRYAKSVLQDPLHRIVYQRPARERKLAPNESGEATRKHDVWTYRTTVSLPAEAMWRVEVRAKNRADREATIVLGRPPAPAEVPAGG